VAPESVRSPLAYYRNNLAKSLNLLDACAAHGVRAFVFSSTAAVYGNPATCPVDERAPAAPISPYGASKLMVEQMLGDLARARPFPHLILRYFNVAGADPELRTGQMSGGADHLIRVACETALGRRASLPIHGDDYPTPDGTCIRDYVHVADLADAHVAALRHLLAGGRSAVLNCGYGRGASVKEVIAAVERVAGTRLPVSITGRRAGDPVAVVARPTRIRRLLRWRPRFADLELMVRHALDWQRSSLSAAA
jgi:UDP-glucose 4-epimerase